jgi:hypothetical protein
MLSHIYRDILEVVGVYRGFDACLLSCPCQKFPVPNSARKDVGRDDIEKTLEKPPQMDVILALSTPVGEIQET